MQTKKLIKLERRCKNVCTRPLARLETYERYTNRKGGISYKAVFDSWGNVEHNPKYYQAKYRRVDQVGCGQCLECMLQKARNKANQMYAEYLDRNKENTWFITLTYSDGNLRPHQTVNTTTGEIKQGFSLCKEDFQKFMKRLRKHYSAKGIENIKFSMCGEYGSETFRPHYHCILFGVPLTDLVYVTNNGTGNLYISQEIQTLWGLGEVCVAKPSWDTFCYVARYMIKGDKSALPKWWYQSQGVIPEYTMQSNRPGLGYNYYQKHKDNLKLTDGFYIPTEKGVQKVQMPRYMSSIWERENKQEYDQRKIERKIHALSNARMQQLQTDLSAQQQREIKESLQGNHFKNLRKDM